MERRRRSDWEAFERRQVDYLPEKASGAEFFPSTVRLELTRLDYFGLR
jgi:hypothetical protein